MTTGLHLIHDGMTPAAIARAAGRWHAGGPLRALRCVRWSYAQGHSNAQEDRRTAGVKSGIGATQHATLRSARRFRARGGGRHYGVASTSTPRRRQEAWKRPVAVKRRDAQCRLPTRGRCCTVSHRDIALPRRGCASSETEPTWAPSSRSSSQPPGGALQIPIADRPPRISPPVRRAGARVLRALRLNESAMEKLRHRIV